MAEERVKRKLTTILAADVEGYSRLMSADEEATLKALNTYREIIDGLISRHDGRIFGAAGDSVLAEFGSTVEAVRCAMSIQEELKVRNAELAEERRMSFRIGINVGDVMVEGDNLFGDGVNVAARLEGLAEAGGICISGSAFDQVKNKLSIGFEDIGAQEVKNIPEPVPAFRVVAGPVSVAATETPSAVSRWRVPALAAGVVVILAVGSIAWWQPWVPDVEPASINKMAFKLPDRPSIAVLPFTNISDDKAQAYFADGITEDIITDLSKVSGLFVVARTSTFTYKGKAVKVRRIAEDLGVRYVLEGSVRRSGDRLRINVQLIDAVKGSHVWAERYDREATDVFAIQDEIATKVAAELAVTLKTDEQQRLYRRHTDNLKAYETYLRAQLLGGPTRNAGRIARRKKLLERVIELDPKFAGGYQGLSSWYVLRVRQGQSASRQAYIERALELAQKAVATDNSFAASYVALSRVYLLKREHDKAVAAGQEAVRVQPSYARAYSFLGDILHWSGRGEEAIDAVKAAMRLDPKAKGNSPMRNAAYLGMASFTAGRYQEAIASLTRYYALRVRRGSNSLSFLAAAYIATGQDEKARAAMKAFLKKKPRTTLSNYQHPRLYKRREDLDRYLNLLRKAGMPE